MRAALASSLLENPGLRFAYRLALELGVWNVRELLTQMSWEQMVGWQEYDKLEPFGREREDFHAGMVASTIANVNRDPKRRARPFTPLDFMPTFARAAKRAIGNAPLTTKSAWEAIKAKARTNATGAPR